MQATTQFPSDSVALPTIRIRSPRFTLALAPWDDPETVNVNEDLTSPSTRAQQLARTRK